MKMPKILLIDNFNVLYCLDTLNHKLRNLYVHTGRFRWQRSLRRGSAASLSEIAGSNTADSMEVSLL